MQASIHAGRQRATFQAVAVKLQAREPSRNSARLDNQCQGTCRQCVRTKPGQGGALALLAAELRPPPLPAPFVGIPGPR